jgi:hypothetical protein
MYIACLVFILFLGKVKQHGHCTEVSFALLFDGDKLRTAEATFVKYDAEIQQKCTHRLCN